MEVSELIWERIGFAVISAIAGAIYGSAVAVVFVFLFHKMSFAFILKVFTLTFGGAGLLFGKRVFHAVQSSIYPLYFLWGVFLATADPVDAAFVPEKGAARNLVLLGALCVILCLLVW